MQYILAQLIVFFACIGLCTVVGYIGLLICFLYTLNREKRIREAAYRKPIIHNNDYRVSVTTIDPKATYSARVMTHAEYEAEQIILRNLR